MSRRCRFRWLHALGPGLLVVAVASPSAADLLPPGQEAIPRRVAFVGIEAFDSHVLILDNCYPQPSEEDPVGMPYCVVTSAEPFVASGRGWIAARSQLELAKRTASVPADAAPEQRLRMKPVVITKPQVNFVDPQQFFGKSPLLTRTELDLGFRDHVAVATVKHLAYVTEELRVDKLDANGIQVTPQKVVWTCEDGTSVEAGAGSAIGKLGEPPGCSPLPTPSASAAPQRRPPVAPRAGGTPKPYWIALAVLAALGLGALLWSRRRGD